MAPLVVPSHQYYVIIRARRELLTKKEYFMYYLQQLSEKMIILRNIIVIALILGTIMWFPILLWDLLVRDIHFPQLWRTSFFRVLAIFAICPVVKIQMVCFRAAKVRWLRGRRMKTFVPSIKTIFWLLLCWPLFYILMTARTTPLTELSWQVIHEEFIREQSYLNSQILCLILLFFYAIYLILFVRR